MTLQALRAALKKATIKTDGGYGRVSVKAYQYDSFGTGRKPISFILSFETGGYPHHQKQRAETMAHVRAVLDHMDLRFEKHGEWDLIVTPSPGKAEVV